MGQENFGQLIQFRQRVQQTQVEEEPVNPLEDNTLLACLQTNPVDTTRMLQEVQRLMRYSELDLDVIGPDGKKATTILDVESYTSKLQNTPSQEEYCEQTEEQDPTTITSDGATANLIHSYRRN